MAITRGAHQALTDSWWLAEDLSKCPTRLYEIVPLQPTLDNYINDSRYMCGGAVLPGPTTVSRTPQLQPSAATTSPETAYAHPIVRWAHFLADITVQLVSWGKSEVQVTNSELELASRLLHHACMENCFDIDNRTMLTLHRQHSGPMATEEIIGYINITT